MKQIDRFGLMKNEHSDGVDIIDRCTGKKIVFVKCRYLVNSINLAKSLLPIVDEFVDELENQHERNENE